MVKKALNLQQLIDLSKTIEGMIGNLQYSIIANNSSLFGVKDKTDVPELYEKLDKAYDQLIIIKSAKHAANSKKSKLKVSNQDLIFELSNLTKKKSFHVTLSQDKLKTRKGGKLDKYKFQISKSDIEDKLIIIEKRIAEIKKAMTDFNTSHTIKVKIYEELELL